MVVSPAASSPSATAMSESTGSKQDKTTDNSSLYSVGHGRRRGSLPRYIDCRIRDNEKDKWILTQWKPSKESNPYPPHLALPSELKRVLLTDNVSEQRVLERKLDKLSVERHKKLELLADKKIQFIDELSKRKNPYIQTVKYGFEQRFIPIPRLRSKDHSHSVPVIRNAAAFLAEHRKTEQTKTPRLPFLRIHNAPNRTDSAPVRRPTSNTSSRSFQSTRSLPILDFSSRRLLTTSYSLMTGVKERKTLSKKCVKDERFLNLEKSLVEPESTSQTPVWRRSRAPASKDDNPTSTWEKRRRNSIF